MPTSLPYIEQEALYREFKLDEPWDSEHNIKLLEKMPEIYAPVGQPPAKPGHTCWQVFTGDKLIFHPLMDLKTRITAISAGDGTTTTLLVVESGKLVPWTKPEDIVYQPFAGQPRPTLGYQVPGRILVGFADASVRVIGNTIMQDILDRLIDPRDGKPIPEDLP